MSLSFINFQCFDLYVSNFNTFIQNYYLLADPVRLPDQPIQPPDELPDEGRLDIKRFYR